MQNPKSVLQLNMGEGKTRVIVPMLILECASGAQVFRLNVLAPLLHEMYDYLHNALSASLLPRRVFTLPFCRDVKLSPELIGTMELAMRHCQASRGVLLVRSLPHPWCSRIRCCKNGQSIPKSFSTKALD